MSRRPARCTEADIRRALNVALKMNPPMAVEILPDGTIRIVPYESGAPRRFNACEDEGSGSSWDDFRAEPVGVGGKQTVSQKADHRVQKWYNQIGYDPKTMSSADFWRLVEAADAKWKTSIPGTPLSKRERDALRQFKQFHVGELIDGRAIKGCGPDTSERLEIRGYIEVRQAKDRLIGYVITAKGLSAPE